MATPQEIQTTRLDQLLKVQTEAAHLFAKKNRDYGDAFAEYGTVGVLVRMGDKIRRCMSITERGVAVTDESLRDTLIDLHNYAAMAVMLIDEQQRKDESKIFDSLLEIGPLELGPPKEHLFAKLIRQKQAAYYGNVGETGQNLSEQLPTDESNIDDNIDIEFMELKLGQLMTQKPSEWDKIREDFEANPEMEHCVWNMVNGDRSHSRRLPRSNQYKY